jgi:amino acid transporter
LSTTVGVILGALEIVIFVLLSLTLLAKAGSANTLSTFGTAHANVKGFEGLPGVIAGSVYGILAFIGFEASAPLGEEARNPRRSVQLAVVGSCIMVGLFYVLGTYAASVFFGVDKMAGFTGANNGNPWTAMAESAWGVGWVIVFITLLNSGLANINGVANAGTRVLFNLGRARALPSALERTHPRFRSPHVAVIFYFVAGAIITLVLGKIYGPTTAYALLGTMAVALVIPTYAITCLASLVYYARQRRDEFNFVLHGVVPVLGILVLLPPLLAGLGVAVFSFISPLQYPLSLAGPIVAVVYLVGIVLAIYFTRTSPERLVETTRLYEEVTPAAVDGSRPMAPVR